MFKPLSFEESGLDRKEWATLKKLDTPTRIQGYLNSLPFNFEKKGETYRSVGEVLRAGEAHCFEGALVAAAALWMHGERPLLLDLTSADEDDDHVVTLFKRNSHWGALSKTNHHVLRYRDPVYRSVRELAMSYFHEYFLDDGSKTMRGYSRPFDLSRQGKNWLSSKENLFDLVDKLDHSPHVDILSTSQARGLKHTDPIERGALRLTEW